MKVEAIGIGVRGVVGVIGESRDDRQRLTQSHMTQSG